MLPRLYYNIIFNKVFFYRAIMQYFLIFGVFISMHCLIWFGTNWQLVNGISLKSALLISVCLSIPISLFSFWGTRIAYSATESAWSIRLLSFGVSYLTFPFLTWVFLHESPFNLKTMICIILSLLIILVQLFLSSN